MTRRELVFTALRRGLRKRCPHCGKGRIFSGWAHHLERCALCGLVFERNPGDTWAFTIIGDRLPIAVIIVLIYFGIGRTRPLLGFGTIALLVVVLVWTAPNRWGVGIALHYLSRVFWPDPADPVPASPLSPAAGLPAEAQHLMRAKVGHHEDTKLTKKIRPPRHGDTEARLPIRRDGLPCRPTARPGSGRDTNRLGIVAVRIPARSWPWRRFAAPAESILRALLCGLCGLRVHRCSLCSLCLRGENRDAIAA